MAVNAGALVKPAIRRRGIHPDEQCITATAIHEIGHVETERIVSSAVAPDVEAVQDNHGLTVCAIELKRDTLAGIAPIELEDAAIPADTGFRILPAEWMKAFAHERRVVDERQFYSPVMWQVE